MNSDQNSLGSEPGSLRAEYIWVDVSQTVHSDGVGMTTYTYSYRDGKRSTKSEIRNPKLGARMPDRGKVIRTLGGTSPSLTLRPAEMMKAGRRELRSEELGSLGRCRIMRRLRSWLRMCLIGTLIT
jgi:hypothetical protein